MRWLPTIKNKQLAPSWTFTTSGILWRLFPSRAGFFVGEDRNVETKTVSFFCLNQRTGDVLWRDHRLAEPWWISVEAIYDSVVLLHEFASPDMPDHKKIYGLDLQSGKTLWSNEELRFLFAYDDRVYAARDQHDQRVFCELDLTTGNFIQEVNADYVNVLRDTVASKTTEFVGFAKPFDTSLVNGTVPEDALRAMTHEARNLAHTEYLETHDAIFVGYYDSLGSNLARPEYQQHVVMMDKKSGSIVYKDIANAHALNVVPDTFFAIQDYVFYIKERKKLTALNTSATTGAHG